MKRISVALLTALVASTTFAQEIQKGVYTEPTDCRYMVVLTRSFVFVGEEGTNVILQTEVPTKVYWKTPTDKGMIKVNRYTAPVKLNFTCNDDVRFSEEAF